MKSIICFTAILSIITIFSSCKNDVKVELPFDEEEVVVLLGDIHFAKSAAAIHKIEKRDSIRSVYEAQVFTIHKITRDDYDELIDLLESDLKLYYDIEKKVHSYLKTVQNEKS